MSVNKKIIIVSLSGLLILGIVAVLFSMRTLKQRSVAEAAFARSMMMEEKKGKLQDLIKSTYAIIQAHYDYAHDPEKIAATYRTQLKSIVDVAYKTVEQVHARMDLADAEKKRLAAQLVSAMRYNENDYLWINDMGPKMVMHPIKPALNGKDLSSFTDPEGKKLFVEFVNVCRDHGEGTVDYLWPKPGHDRPVAKLSYIKLFKPWNWVIGTGVYLEAAEQRFMEDAKKAVAQLRYGSKGTDYFWINDMGPTMVMHPMKPALDGKDLSNNKDPNGKRLFVDMANVCRDKGEGFVDYMWPLPGHQEPVPKLSYVKLFKPWGWVVGTGIYLDDVDRAVAAKEKEIASAIAAQRNGLVMVIVVLLVLTGIGVALIGKRITRPIVTASDMLKDIAQGEGDLTRRLEVSSKDEIGEMAKWFNVFAENIQQIIGSVQENARQVNDSSAELNAIADQTSTNATDTSEKANTVAAASEEMSANMNSVAAAMEEAATNVGMVASAAEEMTATINEIAQNTEKARGVAGGAVDQTANASSQVAELGTAAQEIGTSDRNHHRNLRTGQPAGPQRHHRGGPGRRGRQGFCRSRKRDQGTGPPDRRGHRRDQIQDRKYSELHGWNGDRNRQHHPGRKRSQRNRLHHCHRRGRTERHHQRDRQQRLPGGPGNRGGQRERGPEFYRFFGDLPGHRRGHPGVGRNFQQQRADQHERRVAQSTGQAAQRHGGAVQGVMPLTTAADAIEIRFGRLADSKDSALDDPWQNHLMLRANRFRVLIDRPGKGQQVLAQIVHLHHLVHQPVLGAVDRP